MPPPKDDAKMKGLFHLGFFWSDVPGLENQNWKKTLEDVSSTGTSRNFLEVFLKFIVDNPLKKV